MSQEEKTQILEVAGFDIQSAEAIATLNEQYKLLPVSVANRTKCFDSEKLRHNSIKKFHRVEYDTKNVK